MSTRRMPASQALRPMSRRDVLKAGAAIGAALVPAARVTAQQPRSGPAVWLDMDQAQLDDAYNQRVYAPNIDRLAEQNGLRNRQARARLGAPQRFAYGSGAVETLDVYPTQRDGAPVQVYIHGGTWRYNTADMYAYLAEPCVNNGAHMVIVDFSGVESAEGGLPTLVRQVRDAVAWTYRNAERFGGNAQQLYVTGHSSGGHLAAMVLTTDWQGSYGLPADLVKGGLCASGMYDLEPVRLSWRNSYLQLTAEMVETLSPQRHLEHLTAPLLVAYGTYETPEFQRQARDFAAAVEAAGKPVEVLVGPGFNHFEIRDTLSSDYGLLGRAVLEQMGLAGG